MTELNNAAIFKYKACLTIFNTVRKSFAFDRVIFVFRKNSDIFNLNFRTV